MQMPLTFSVVSLANSSSLYPFPEQLKGRKLVEIGEKTAFKPGYRTNVSAILISASLCKESLCLSALGEDILFSHCVLVCNKKACTR